MVVGLTTTCAISAYHHLVVMAIVTDDRSSVDVDITIIDLENVTDSHHY
jgi:hypothetical protein